MTLTKTFTGPAALAAGIALALSGCAATGAGTDSTSGESTGQLTVVASTNVWGSIAQAIGGDAVSVTSLIDSSAQDPHEFEATARDQLAVNDAQLILENGGGYDDFVDTMLDAAEENSARVVLNAVDNSGLDTGDSGEGEFNEHVWYSFPTVDAVAQQLANELASLDPDNADTFQSNYEEFSGELDQLTSRLDGIAADHGGAHVLITEPVPLYLLEAAGLVNETPDEFSEAVEEGTDVPALVLEEVKGLLDSGNIVLLAYNEQTVTNQTEAVLDQATADGVPVVSFAETLPDGVTDYIDWMTTTIDTVEEALNS